jgi:hypothetical protein
MVNRTVPFMQVLGTRYLRGRGPQRTRKAIKINFNKLIAVPDAYIAGVGFVQGNETGAPASPVAISLAQVISEPMRDATIRMIPPSILLSNALGADFAALFVAGSQIQVQINGFTPTTKTVGMQCVGTHAATTGPVQEPVAAGPAGIKVSGTLYIEVDYTSNDK